MTTLTPAENAARERLIHWMLTARELPDVLAATEALHQWRQEYPDDYGILDGGEVLSHRRDFAEWRAANPEEWAAEQEAERRAIALHQPERDRMLARAWAARTAMQLDRAERDLFQWNADHPEDVGRELGILEALMEVLARREALEAQAAPALVGQAV